MMGRIKASELPCPLLVMGRIKASELPCPLLEAVTSGVEEIAEFSEVEDIPYFTTGMMI